MICIIFSCIYTILYFANIELRFVKPYSAFNCPLDISYTVQYRLKFILLQATSSVSQTQSLMLLRNLLRASISEICFLRHLLPGRLHF
jgi:hypothetical protein